MDAQPLLNKHQSIYDAIEYIFELDESLLPQAIKEIKYDELEKMRSSGKFIIRAPGEGKKGGAGGGQDRKSVLKKVK